MGRSNFNPILGLLQAGIISKVLPGNKFEISWADGDETDKILGVPKLEENIYGKPLFFMANQWVSCELSLIIH